MVAMSQEKTFGDFILMEMRKRDMSARAFARFVGVDSKTINKFLDYGTKDVGQPSVEFLSKLALATHTDPCVLLAMVIPEAFINSKIAPGDMALSQRIAKLPPHLRDAIDVMLMGAVLKSGKKIE